LEAKYTKARPDQKHDNTIHDLTNRVRVRCGIVWSTSV
jgi:hypothetical protein